MLELLNKDFKITTMINTVKELVEKVNNILEKMWNFAEKEEL